MADKSKDVEEIKVVFEAAEEDRRKRMREMTEYNATEFKTGDHLWCVFALEYSDIFDGKYRLEKCIFLRSLGDEAHEIALFNGGRATIVRKSSLSLTKEGAIQDYCDRLDGYIADLQKIKKKIKDEMSMKTQKESGE